MATPKEIIEKIAEAYYIKRIKEDIDGSPEGDYRKAEKIYDFFEDDNRTKDCWYELELLDYKDFYPIYATMRGINNDRQIT